MSLSYCVVPFHFGVQNSLEHFLQERVHDHKWPQILLIWICFNSSLFCEEQHYWMWFLGKSFLFHSHGIYHLIDSCSLKFLRKSILSIIMDKLYWGSLICDGLLLFCYFQNSLFIFVFRMFNYNVCQHVFFTLSVLWKFLFTFK
jgi:hypothetical protein